MDLQMLNTIELQRLFLDLHGKYIEASKHHVFGFPKSPEHREAAIKINEVMNELNKRRKQTAF